MRNTDHCANCGEQIVPDPDDEWHHRADDVAGCGTEDAEGHELYATPINTKEN